MSRYSPHQTVINYNAGGKADRLLIGVLLMAVGETLIVISGAAIKHLTLELPVVQVMFFRSLFGLLFVVPFVVRIGASALKTQKIAYHLLRGIFGVSAMFFMFYSFHALFLTEAVLLKATSPIMLLLIAGLLLREKIAWQGWCAIVLAFVGVVIIVNPSEVNLAIRLGFFAGLASAALAAYAKIMVRKLGQTEPSAVIVFYFLLCGSLFTLPFALNDWHAVNVGHWGAIIVVAVFSTLGQLAITKAYTVAPVNKVAMFTYLSIPVAGVLGWVFWGEALSHTLVIGTLVIIAAGLLTVRSSRAR